MTEGAPGSTAPERRSGGRGWRAGVASASVATLARPQAWPLALAGFLVRGGILLFIPPILVVPTTTGLATFFGPLIARLITSGPDAGIIALGGLAIALVLVALVGGGLLGAATDVVLVDWLARDVTGGPELAGRGPLPGSPRGLRTLSRRTFGVRLAAHLPLVVVAPWTVSRIVDATYNELMLPSDVALPLVVRVVRAAAVPVVVLVLAWFLGETVGGLAAREVVLGRASAGTALGRGVLALVRHPAASVATAALGLAGLVVLVAPALLAAVLVWEAIREILLGGGSPLSALLGATILAATWTGALLLAAVATTWRSALWTAFSVRLGSPGATPRPHEPGPSGPPVGA